MAKLFTWPLADALATALITAYGGDFKLCAFKGVAPCATSSMSASLADALAAAVITAFGDFKLHLYTGTMPATSTLLAGSFSTYTRLITYQATVVDGQGKYGIDWDSVTTGTGIAHRLMSQSVQGVAAATGSATWGVITNVDDTLGAAPTAKRYGFTVGTSGADVNLTTVSFTSGSTYPLTSALTVPVSGISTALAASLGTPSITYLDSGGSAGIDWDSVAANSGIAKRLITQGIQGVAVESTSLTYVILCPIADTLAATTDKRILFTVGTAGSGAGVTLEDVAVVSGTTYPLLAAVSVNVGNTA